jgi:hypothetical protein
MVLLRVRRMVLDIEKNVGHTPRMAERAKAAGVSKETLEYILQKNRA